MFIVLTSPLYYFSDPILRGPTIGCVFMGIAAALIGTLISLRRQALAGEMLSHAAYPGIILAALIAGLFDIGRGDDTTMTMLTSICAFITSCFGLLFIRFLQHKAHIANDAALCFVLATFFGIGVAIASQVQIAFGSQYRHALIYLYGQAATMTDLHVAIYALLALACSIWIFIYYHQLLGATFDPLFAAAAIKRVHIAESGLFFLLLLTVILSTRSLGVVLMSGMLIAPTIAARQWTNHLHTLLLLSAFIGAASGWIGNYLSSEWSIANRLPGQVGWMLPTGPMVVLVAFFACVLSLLLAPRRGLLGRLIRLKIFHHRCREENILKTLWRKEQKDCGSSFSLDQIASWQPLSKKKLRFSLFILQVKKLVSRQAKGYTLTSKGKQRAAHIIRLHRLWELYLVKMMGMGVERVHCSAEEMEHILSPELERELSLALNNPQSDPHAQPIPQASFTDLDIR